jgi:hypothetical protein
MEEGAPPDRGTDERSRPEAGCAAVVQELAAFIGGGAEEAHGAGGRKDVDRSTRALERAPEIVGGLVGA